MSRRRAPGLDETRVHGAPALLAHVLRERDDTDAVAKAAFFGDGPGGLRRGGRLPRGPRPGAAQDRAEPTCRDEPGGRAGAARQRVPRGAAAGAIPAVGRFKGSDADEARAVVDLVLGRIVRLDNWDLVDGVAPYVLGAWLADRSEELPVLTRLMDSPDQWSRRFALVATVGLIRRGILTPTISWAERALTDDSVFVHKAAGWMLRGVGRRDVDLLNGLLERRCAEMPQVMLRTSQEKHDPDERRRYLRIPRGAALPRAG